MTRDWSSNALYLSTLFLTTITGYARTIASQAPRVIDAKSPACRECRIELTKIATLGRLDDSELPGPEVATSALAIDRKGQFYATSLDVTKVIIYDETGRVLRTIGRKGGGPGEFSNATKLALGQSDSLFVLDGMRIMGFNSQGGYVRTVSLPYPKNSPFVAVSTGEIALTSDPRSPSSKTFMLVGSNGQVRHVGNAPTAPMACPTCNRLIGPGSLLNKIWTAQSNSYSIERWNVINGDLEGVFSISGSKWMSNWTDPSIRPDLNVPPKPRITGIAEDSLGQLWITGLLPTPGWKPLPRRTSQPAGFGSLNLPPGGQPPSEAQHARMVTAIDIIDTKTNHLVVSQELKGRMLHLIRPPYFGQAREDAQGVPVWDIYRAEIRRQ